LPADYLFFFFSSRRRHTRSDRDWSSDVCSSDLHRPDGVEAEPRKDGYQVDYRWSGKKDNASVIPRVLLFIGLRLRTVLPFIHDCHGVREGSQRALSPKPGTTWIAVSEQGCGDVAPAHMCRGCFDSGSLVGLGIHP